MTLGPRRGYQLDELLGMGRRSLVYRGTDRQLSGEGFSAKVVIKIASRPGSGAIDARSARRVEHPNVVSILDLGVDPESGSEYVVSEYLAGGGHVEAGGPR